MRKLLILITALATLVPASFAQKVKFGYDKSIDFSKYKTYSYPPIKNPDDNEIKAQAAMGEIDYNLKQKGMTRVDSGGDIIIVGNAIVAGQVGGMEGTAILPWDAAVYTEYGSMWTGWTPAPGSLVLKGAMSLQFYDTSTHKPIWSGSVVQKLDPGGLGKNMKRISEAIDKLLEKYPPKE